MSGQCFLPPKVGVEGELMSKKRLSPKNFDQATAFLLTAHCLALPNAQSSHGLKVPVTWILRALAIAQVIDSDGRLSSTWRLLIFFVRSSSRLHPLIISFSKKFDSGYPAIMNLDSAIKDDVAICRLDHKVVLMVV